MKAKGIFISEFQETFDPQGNIDYIFVRSSIGLEKDKKYNEFLPAVKTIEQRGAVHCFLTAVCPIEQAEFFFRAQGGQGFKMLAMDYEGGAGNVLDADGEKNFWRFYKHLQTLTDKPLLLYCGEYILRDYLLKYNDRWLEVEQWLARYPGDVDIDTFEPYQLGIRDDWTFWQWEADGNGKGAEYGVGSDDVCLDVFNGSLEELKTWLNIESPELPLPNCDKLVQEAVKQAQVEFTEQIAVLNSEHEKVLAEAIIKANNESLENLIKPHKR